MYRLCIYVIRVIIKVVDNFKCLCIVDLFIGKNSSENVVYCIVVFMNIIFIIFWFKWIGVRSCISFNISVIVIFKNSINIVVSCVIIFIRKNYSSFCRRNKVDV